MDATFASLDGFEPTRRTLHAYSRVIGAVPRRYAPSHPKWWHISLRVAPDELRTASIPLPDGNTLKLKLDLQRHVVVVATSSGVRQEFPMTDGLSANQMADRLHAAVAQFGLPPEYDAGKYADDSATVYDIDAAERFLNTLVVIDGIFEDHRAALEGECSPVQLWPHGFDLAFEWFGTRQVQHEENGRMETYPSQLNLGFYPGNEENEAYFYSNPFPFDEAALTSHALPAGARWFTEGWQGSYFPYAELAGRSDAATRLREFARRVYAIAAPTLSA